MDFRNIYCRYVISQFVSFDYLNVKFNLKRFVKCFEMFILDFKYRKPPTISPGLIYFRKRFLMGLYKGGYIRGGGLYMDDLLC